jgi:hypothetical protein
MPSSNLDQEIQGRIHSFLSELSGLVKKAALEAVHEALGENGAPRRGPGRPRGSGRRGPRRAGRPARRAAGGKRIRRSAVELSQISARVLAQVRSKAGQRLEEIGRALKTDTAILKRPVAMLVASKKLKTTGQKRGTKYFVR